MPVTENPEFMPKDVSVDVWLEKGEKFFLKLGMDSEIWIRSWTSKEKHHRIDDEVQGKSRSPLKLWRSEAFHSCIIARQFSFHKMNPFPDRIHQEIVVYGITHVADSHEDREARRQANNQSRHTEYLEANMPTEAAEVGHVQSAISREIDIWWDNNSNWMSIPVWLWASSEEASTQTLAGEEGDDRSGSAKCR